MKKKIILYTLLALMVSACQCGNDNKPATEPEVKTDQPEVKTDQPAVKDTPEATQAAPEKPMVPASPLDPKREMTEEQKKKAEEIARKLEEKIDSILAKAVEEGKLTAEQLKELEKQVK